MRERIKIKEIGRKKKKLRKKDTKELTNSHLWKGGDLYLIQKFILNFKLSIVRP